MNKTVYLLNIGNYAPEMTALTYPFITAYAERIGAKVCTINNRAYSLNGGWDIDYEKFQIYELADLNDDDWSIYIDSDALIHPETPDLTELLPDDHVAAWGVDFAPSKYDYDDYFRRDGRHLGIGSWIVVTPRACRDLWRPQDDIGPTEAESRIHPGVPETNSGLVTPGHLVSDYCISRNLARYGLKLKELRFLWRELNHPHPNPQFFYHVWNAPISEKIAGMRQKIEEWSLTGWLPPEPSQPPVVDLMAALEKSLERAKRGQS